MNQHQSDESGTRTDAAARRWAEVIEREGRAARQRVVPLPLALAALLLPFLAAWATAEDRPTGDPWAAGARLSKALPEPLEALSRATRLAEPGTGYVDLWGPLAPWEEAYLGRRAGAAGR